MVRWMKDTFELDQPYKQIEKNASNKKGLKQ